MQKVSPEKSGINISGYNPTISGATDKNTWQLLDDRIILRTRGAFGKVKETEIFLKDIVAVQKGFNSVYIQTSAGKIHTGYDIFCLTPEQQKIAIPYICGHYGKLYEQQLARRKAIDELNSQVKEGKWPFPCETFYRQCAAEKILQLNNEFSLLKAKQIAANVIREADPKIALSSCSRYLTESALVKLHACGKQLADKADLAKQEQQQRPRSAAPTQPEASFLKKSENLSRLSGRNKRVAMLKDLAAEYGARIQAMREGEQALKQLGMLYLEQQRKETSWATMGGLAEGLAGPGAGVAAAIHTMANNEKIREHNAAMRKVSMDILSGVPSLTDDRHQLEKEMGQIQQNLASAQSKITLSNPKADDIYRNLHIGDCTVQKGDSGVLKLSLPVSLKQPFCLDVPEGIRMVVDGTLTGEVWMEDQYVGAVYFPFPLFGIRSDDVTGFILDGMCSRFVDAPGTYTVKLADQQNLWIMEA